MATYAPVREVRFALVLYGGVSLAVYINGVTQELFSLVRATAPRPPLDLEDPVTELYHDDAELHGTEPVYRRLGRMHGAPDAASPTGPVRTRFVVDIISGSSAGGINGVYLGKALANEQDFASLRRLWVEKGDVAALLNDRTSRKPRADRLPEKEPAESLFSSDLMYLELLDALDAMDGARPVLAVDEAPPSAYVDNLDVWVTATDLEGRPQALALADSTILERKHRHTFHFVFGEAQALTGRRNDFATPMNPILAFAARATSSFPFAFVPARLVDIGRVVRRHGGTSERPDPRDPAWRRWFRDQVQVPNYEEVSFGDGGDMDNKPFGWAIDTLPARTSSVPVDRQLLYVEPDPGDAGAPGDRAAPRPDVIGSTIAAVSLGRTENIRDDLQRLAKVSDVRERLAAVKGAIDDRYTADRSSEAKETPTDAWLTEPPAAMKARGLDYAAYFTLRVDALSAEFARSLVGLPWHAADTPEVHRVRTVVDEWVGATFADPFEVDGATARTTKHYLQDYDISFRLRRLAFVAGEADRYLRTIEGNDEVAARLRAEAHRIKRLLGAAEERLRTFVPSVRSNPDPPSAGVPASAAELAPYAEGVAVFLRDVFRQASAAVKKALGGGQVGSPERAVRGWVRDYYDRFADFDQAMFPLQAAAGALGELDAVQVRRISPRDATSLVDPADRPKVAGSRLGHFGGFIDASWRANDIMWGRLDTVDQLVECLAPPEEAERLRDEAHDAILREEWYAEGRGGAKHLSDPRATLDDDAARRWRRETFRAEYAPPPWPPTARLVRLSSRALRVTSSMLEGVTAVPGGRVLHKVVAALAWLVAAVATLFFPRDATRTPVRSLSAAVAVVGVVLTVLGGLLNWDAAAGTGPVLVAVGVVALVLVLLVRIARRNARQALVWTVALVLAVLAIYGGARLWGDARRWLDDGDEARPACGFVCGNSTT